MWVQPHYLGLAEDQQLKPPRIWLGKPTFEIFVCCNLSFCHCNITLILWTLLVVKADLQHRKTAFVSGRSFCACAQPGVRHNKHGGQLLLADRQNPANIERINAVNIILFYCQKKKLSYSWRAAPTSRPAKF